MKPDIFVGLINRINPSAIPIKAGVLKNLDKLITLLSPVTKNNPTVQIKRLKARIKVDKYVTYSFPSKPLTRGIPKNATLEKVIANCSMRCVLPKINRAINNPINMDTKANPKDSPSSDKTSKLKSILKELMIIAGVHNCKRIVDN